MTGRRRIRPAWRRVAEINLNRHPFNPRARYADLENRKDIVYFAAIAYREELNFHYRRAMQQKRISKKVLEQIREAARRLASVGLYELEHFGERAQ